MLIVDPLKGLCQPVCYGRANKPLSEQPVCDMDRIGRSRHSVGGIIDARSMKSGEVNMKNVVTMQCTGMLVRLQAEETGLNVMATSEGRRFPVSALCF